ncbi:MAG: hypothetical protein ACTHMC_14430 [Pseudobacter sp.]|uniref:hypothetical protein n=1 Tax=Pseudobacter sp. TaxID=2045420 RepID=UPI003F7EEED4
MSDHSQHITHYTAADIQRYLGGSMTASEMHAMEKAALEDPFLADAIEGMETAMQAHGETPVNTNLDELHATIAERTRPGRKVRAITWWRFSAAAVVLIAAGIFVWNSFLNKEHESANQIATVQTQTKADTPARLQPVVTDEGFPAEFNTADSDAIAGNAKLSKKKELSAKQVAEAEQFANQSARQAQKSVNPSANRLFSAEQHNQTLADGKTIPLDTNVPAKVAPARIDEKDLAKRAENLRNQWNLSDTSNTEVVGVLQSKVPGVTIAQANNNNAKLSNVIRGRVTDNFARPIPNANLNLQSNQGFQSMGESYFTDREGFFNIPSKQYDTSALNISVAAAGYNTQSFQLNRNVATNQLNTLQLEPANQALNEIMVRGYGPHKKAVSGKASRDIDLLQQNAEPAYGWVGYEKYLRESNRMSQDSSNVKGEAVVTFIVNRSGVLSDFNVSGDLPQAARNEAIRLVKEGPGWKIKRGRKATATVIVRF